MSDFLPARMDVDAPLFTVTMAARLAEMHPQTLRGYDRLGLVVPSRAKGRGRRYTLRDVARLRHIQELSQEEGINLEGIRRILELEAQLEEAQAKVDDIATMDAVLNLILLIGIPMLVLLITNLVLRRQARRQ